METNLKKKKKNMYVLMLRTKKRSQKGQDQGQTKEIQSLSAPSCWGIVGCVSFAVIASCAG